VTSSAEFRNSNFQDEGWISYDWTPVFPENTENGQGRQLDPDYFRAAMALNENYLKIFLNWPEARPMFLAWPLSVICLLLFVFIGFMSNRAGEGGSSEERSSFSRHKRRPAKGGSLPRERRGAFDEMIDMIDMINVNNKLETLD
jgi:hypothetical protein